MSFFQMTRKNAKRKNAIFKENTFISCLFQEKPLSLHSSTG